MKILHISDLHLGKKIGNFSMYENQEDILGKIYNTVVEEKPQALLISGDIYDKTVPSTEAVTLFDEFLVKLSKLDNLAVFIISGNHDSAERIAFGNRLISSSGIYLSPTYNGNIPPITLKDEYGDVDFYMLPYIRPTLVRQYFHDIKIESYDDALKCAIDNMNIDMERRNILLSHQATTNAIRCEAENNIGGLDTIDYDPYLKFDYVALGHIHTPQTIRKNHIRYSGSPLKYAFDECEQTKSITKVEILEKGNVNLTEIPLKPKYDFVSIKGLFNEICEKYRENQLEDYVEVVLTDEMDIPNAFRQLQNYFPKLVKLHYDNKKTSEKKIVHASKDVQIKEPIEIFKALFMDMNNCEMNLEQIEYMENIIKEIKEEDK